MNVVISNRSGQIRKFSFFGGRTSGLLEEKRKWERNLSGFQLSKEQQRLFEVSHLFLSVFFLPFPCIRQVVGDSNTRHVPALSSSTTAKTKTTTTARTRTATINKKSPFIVPCAIFRRRIALEGYIFIIQVCWLDVLRCILDLVGCLASDRELEYYD